MGDMLHLKGRASQTGCLEGVSPLSCGSTQRSVAVSTSVQLGLDGCQTRVLDCVNRTQVSCQRQMTSSLEGTGDL